jgi:D-alanyl-D-alanine carboxypeptidase
MSVVVQIISGFDMIARLLAIQALAQGSPQPRITPRLRIRRRSNMSTRTSRIARPIDRWRLLLAVPSLLLVYAAVPSADRVDDYVKSRMEEFHLPGLSLAVVRDGEVIKAAGYGLADVERKIAAQPATVYKIGSVSKQFIAAGIMLLAQEGRLSVDDSIAKYLEGAPPPWTPITIRHVLTHTSGLVRESPAFDPVKIQDDAVLLRAVFPISLRFPPGDKWEYSNAGYFALADIIRAVSGRPWTDYLHDKVFRPVGMNATWPTNASQGTANAAIGYSGKDNTRTAPLWRALRASGAFLSTVLDLAKWDAVLYKNEVLSETSRRQMWTPVQLASGTAPYGFGWHVDSILGHRRVRHGGGMPGFAAEFMRFPDARLTVIALTNGDDVDLPDIVAGIAALYLPRSSSAVGSRVDGRHSISPPSVPVWD